LQTGLNRGQAEPKNQETMKKWLLLFLPLASLAQDRKTEIESMMAKAAIPGLSLVYVKDGKIAESYALGLRSNDTRLPVDSNTIFAAASLSKCVFAYGLLQLVDQGRINLDSPLARYVDYKDVKHDPRYKLVTVREALSHTAGLPNWRNGSELNFQYDPGKQFRYSGEGFVWLSKAMDTLTGESTEQWMQKNVFAKLAMNNSSYLWQERYAGDYAQPHSEIGKTRSKYYPKESNVAHSLQTTANDYGRFLLALLNKKGLKPATVVALNQAQPHSAFADYGGKLAWGLGLGYGQSDHGDYFWQWGDNGTYKAFLIGFPGKKEGLVYFTNSSNGLAIANQLLQLFFTWDGQALKWLDYANYQSSSFQMYQRMAVMPAKEAIKPYLVADGSIADSTKIKDDYYGDIIYMLIDQKRWDEAKWLAQMNAKAFPNSSNAYANLALASLRSGDRAGAADACLKMYAIDSSRKSPKLAADRLLEKPDTSAGVLHEFRLPNFGDARNVQLVGQFNDWNDFTLPMKWQDGAWTIKIHLKAGKYMYKFIVDGIWIPDMDNKQVNVDDNFNSIVEIK